MSHCLYLGVHFTWSASQTQADGTCRSRRPKPQPVRRQNRKQWRWLWSRGSWFSFAGGECCAKCTHVMISLQNRSRRFQTFQLSRANCPFIRSQNLTSLPPCSMEPLGHYLYIKVQVNVGNIIRFLINFCEIWHLNCTAFQDIAWEGEGGYPVSKSKEGVVVGVWISRAP